VYRNIEALFSLVYQAKEQEFAKPSGLGAPELTESHRKSAYTLLHVDRFVPEAEANLGILNGS
jgi:hypothetical protein